MKPKILIFDIENSAHLCFSFDTWDARINPDDIEVPSYIYCISYRWYGQKKIHTISIRNFPLFKKDIHSDREVLKAFAKVWAEADIVVGHNIKKFDIKKINWRLDKHKLPPYEHKKIYDTLLIDRQYFGRPHHSLDAVAKDRGYVRKIVNEKGLSKRCWYGDVKALKEMETYNRRDVLINTLAFEDDMPFLKTGVSKNVRCSNDTCGSYDIQMRGIRGNTHSFQCNVCFKWGHIKI